MAELSRRSGMVTVSLGSGPAAEVAFLFTNDICGEGEATPRHARKYGDLARLYREIDAERIRSLQAFRVDVSARTFPAATEVANVPDALLEEFARRLAH
jgi:3-methyl-2-oxobutanoate hydroxymethyltransferase